MNCYMCSLIELFSRRLLILSGFLFAEFYFLTRLMMTPCLLYLARGRSVLFLLAGISFLVLIACSGGGGGSDSMDGDPGGNRSIDGSLGGGSPRAFEVDITFAPISGGFRIGNQSDFGDFVSLNITATSGNGSVIEERNINIAEFIDDNYEFTGLNDQFDWTFAIRGTLRDGSQQEVMIAFVWEENEEDHASGGIRSGINKDGDGRVDSVDEDDDGDGLDDSSDQCRVGETDWMSNRSTDHDGDGCRDASSEDNDDDNDEVDDISDGCSRGETDWMSDRSTDHDGDGCRDDGEDTDDDNDEVDDSSDQCRVGETDWMSNRSTDHDGDGCRDASSEDTDDDNDEVDDISDGCSRGETDWMSNRSTDHDGDGCRDASSEDNDDDNDEVDDISDGCSRGETDWMSNRSTDRDGDGCRDDGEDTDDDNDLLPDLMDTGMVDGRECRLHEDCDNDEIGDSPDQCRVGETDWRSNRSTDHDGDGCRDDGEDTDDDNDLLPDLMDTGMVDGRECRLHEDCDNDEIGDSSDQCRVGETDWRSNRSTDHDGDGCRDDGEDTDDDNDEVDDISDGCSRGETDWMSNRSTDHDGDGCRDDGEDTDDDNDGLDDGLDLCPTGVTDWTRNGSSDHDGDGCRDADEDTDCSDSIAGVECSIDLGGTTDEFLRASDRDYFVVDLEEAGILSLWILGSLNIEVSLLNEEEASRLRDEGNSSTSRPYDQNYAGDQYFYELAAGRHYLEIVNKGPPISLTLVTSFQPALIDSCGSTQNTACPLDNLINLASGSIYSTNGSIYPINDSDMFKFYITRPGRLTFWLESQLDSEASLRDEDGNRLVYDDDGGYGYDFKISQNVHSLGRGLYYLDITSGFSSLDYPRFGPYELFVQFIPMGEERRCELADTVGGSQPNRTADPLLAYQWYLDRIGVKEVWAEGHEGQGVHISVVDNGLDMMHEDLIQNIIANASRNYLVKEDHPSRHSPLPTDCWEDGHGTAVAGIAAARGDNGLGIKGVAPEAGIYMANYLQQQSLTSLLDAFSRKTDETLVSVNSWGSLSYTRLTKRNKLVLETIEAHLDHPLNSSISYVFSAGNNRGVQMATYQGMRNHRGAITVCATNALDSYASYSNPGINLWVCAPSGDDISADAPAGLGSPLGEWQLGLATTDLTGRAGYNQGLAPPPVGSPFGNILESHLDFGGDAFYYREMDYRSDYISYDGNLIAGLPGTDAYTRFFFGTSAAAPVVGGVIALIRSAYPALSWRDTKLILAESAEQVDASAASWQIGGTAYHDTGSHYTHSIDYGFGLVDAAAALDLAAEWQVLPLERRNETIEKTTLFGPVNIEDTIRIGDIGFDFIEYVQLEIDSSYADFGHLDIELISPRGIRSLVARRHICARGIRERDCADLEGGFTFASAAHLGEDPRGDWTLIIGGAASPTRFDWQLRFYGHQRGAGSALDSDDDNDGVNDYFDRCPTGTTGWASNGSIDHDGDGCRDADEDNDDDNDGRNDVSDRCSTGAVGWTSNPYTDHDRDGCRDRDEDEDDDNDGVDDDLDLCRTGTTGWTSNPSSDYDGDGCRDRDEDEDDDNDGVDDDLDLCRTDVAGWTSNGSSDNDGDGCRDVDEDRDGGQGTDDDNDGVDDDLDLCRTGVTDWESNGSSDYDGDGCRDADEDPDDDNDEVDDDLDLCRTGVTDWMSNGSSDNDGDGCRDVDEDRDGGQGTDDDNDGVDDDLDLCRTGVTDWASNGSSDNDGDGCRDRDEDNDDDNDGLDDDLDRCFAGVTGWTRNGSSDHDGDGCRDADEDDDDDNDGVDDDLDLCRTGVTNWTSNPSSDHDGDGCRDADEDDDDDNDGLDDDLDRCFAGVTDWMRNGSSDNDGDGCRDVDEDRDGGQGTDDDNDGLDDDLDRCPTGATGWTSNGSNDNDGDGCRDMDEDPDDDNDGLDDDLDRCPTGVTDWTRNGSSDNDGDGCRDVDEDRDGGQGTDDDNDGLSNELDLDLDGDGLIEIATAAELDAVRYSLNGNGRRLSEDAVLNTTGCGGARGVTSCFGYELVANISLVDYRDDKGWQPLGHDTDSSTYGCQGAAFNGAFDGNSFRISNLTINRPSEDCVGLFSHITEGSEIRNLILSAEAVIGKDFVGGLMGWGRSASIYSSSVVADEVSGSIEVGGLVGAGESVLIHSSSVVVNEVKGFLSVGGLVGWGRSASIYSSSLVAGVVNGNTEVGGLVGGGGSARIDSSSVVAGVVNGSIEVGGLMGWGRSASIYSSSVVAGVVNGNTEVGGLVGWGRSASIYSSSVVAGVVNGSIEVGGLVGNGHSAWIVSSSVVAGEVSGIGDRSRAVGGLVGWGRSASIYSSSVVAGEVSGIGDRSRAVGGLVGYFEDGRVAYSYVVLDSDTAMLVGRGDGTGVASYWDSETSDINIGNHGEAKTSNDLRMPTGYTDIYATWNDETNIFGDGDEPLAVWCDEDNSGSIEMGERTNGNLIWDFGTSSEYPAIHCTPIAPVEWRSWWFLNATDQLQLNQTRLDELLP